MTQEAELPCPRTVTRPTASSAAVPPRTRTRSSSAPSSPSSSPSTPPSLTLAELTRELSEDPEHPAQRDAVDRALRDLAGSGLLHRHGSFVLPTRAALRFDRLALP